MIHFTRDPANAAPCCDTTLPDLGALGTWRVLHHVPIFSSPYYLPSCQYSSSNPSFVERAANLNQSLGHKDLPQKASTSTASTSRRLQLYAPRHALKDRRRRIPRESKHLSGFP